MDTRKYIFENGMMRLNPAFKAQQTNQGQVSTAPPNSLAIVSSTNDVMQASQAQMQATGQGMQLSQATTFSMEIMQDQDYLNRFQAPQKIDGGQILDGISNMFEKYEVPIGLVNKLLALTEYKLNFIIDDSGSMGNDSDAPLVQASSLMKQRFRQQNRQGVMTRWEEAEDRLHVMIDMLAYIPTDIITIGFLNRQNVVKLDHRGKTPEQFAQEAHMQVTQAFARSPSGQTPILKHLEPALKQSVGSTMHYLFTDGVPTDCTVDALKSLVLHRPNPNRNPLTFMSCTDNDEEADWMKEIEEAAPFTAELDDFASESREVLKDQGPGFPFTRGFWLLCQLVAAINPHDLDALDESRPFTKMTVDNLLGRKTTPQEYDYYFRNNPNARQYQHLYQQFCREDIMAHQILQNQNSGNYSSLPPNQSVNNTQYNSHANQYPNGSQYQPYPSQVGSNNSNQYNNNMTNNMPSQNPQYQSQQSGMMPPQGGFNNTQNGFGSSNQNGFGSNNQSNNFASNNNYNPGFWSQNPSQTQNTNQFGNQANNQPNNPTYNNRPGFGR